MSAMWCSYSVLITQFLCLLFSAFLNKDGDVICKPRKVLIPIDAPLYRYYPRFVEVFRCGGACSTHSPNLQQCLAATWNNISGDIYDLSSSTVKAAAFENHTSCQCECVVRAKDCSENEEFLPDLCNCRCKYENEPPTPCPERFMYVWESFGFYLTLNSDFSRDVPHCY